MFKFFTQKKWFLWSIFGSIFILSATSAIVYIDVQINKWFGEFYDVLQNALSKPGSVELNDFLDWCYKFAKLAAIYIIVLIFSDFFFFSIGCIRVSVFKSIDLALVNSSFVIAPSLKRLFNWVNSSVILAANETLQVNKNKLININKFFINKTI